MEDTGEPEGEQQRLNDRGDVNEILYAEDSSDIEEYNIDDNAMVSVENVEDSEDMADIETFNDSNNIIEDGDSEEEQQFDISLAASHSYLGAALEGLGGRVVLEPGWAGLVPCVALRGAVFPGETVPMLLPHARDAALLHQTIHRDKIFGLLCPDESGTALSGYGVLCEVFEAGPGGGGGAGGGAGGPLSFKARAIHRCRLVHLPEVAAPVQLYSRVREVEVRVLPEVRRGDPLRPPRLASLDPLRRGSPTTDRRLRSMDAAVSPWPRFVFDMFEFGRLRAQFAAHFRALMVAALPEDPVSLSFWVAANLPLRAADRLALLAADDALLRLHLARRLLAARPALCCGACGARVAAAGCLLPMSSEGLHSTYTNLGGYMHNVVTVSAAQSLTLSGAPSAEFSWFPGYAWTIALCAVCLKHLGWRYDALKKGLRPQQFYGLCRDHVQPCAEEEAGLPACPAPQY